VALIAAPPWSLRKYLGAGIALDARFHRRPASKVASKTTLTTTTVIHHRVVIRGKFVAGLPGKFVL
jgi:hypothetical protein